MTHQDYAKVFKTLSHASRLKLIELLARQGEMSVSQLTGEMPLQESTVSRHLNLLSLSGIVSARQEAQNRYYSLDPDRLQQVFHGYLSDQLEQPAPQPAVGGSR